MPGARDEDFLHKCKGGKKENTKRRQTWPKKHRTPVLFRFKAVLRPFLSKGYKVTSGKKNSPRSKGNRRKTGRAESSAVKIEIESQIVDGCLLLDRQQLKNFPLVFASTFSFSEFEARTKEQFHFGNRNEFMRLLSGF
ncbi:MAG: hypothetical protein IJ909_04125 [Fibrobacter sp.]|nr:hypothetical protein [Fibrobacter sp.]